MEYRLKLSLIDDDETSLFVSVAINFAHVRFGSHAFADNIALQQDSVRFARTCNVSDIRVICGEQVIRLHFLHVYRNSIIIFDQLQKEFSRFYSTFNLQQRRNRSSFSPFLQRTQEIFHTPINRYDGFHPKTNRLLHLIMRKDKHACLLLSTCIRDAACCTLCFNVQRWFTGLLNFRTAKICPKDVQWYMKNMNISTIEIYLRISRSDRNVETNRGIPSLSFVATLNGVDLLHASWSSLQPVPGTLSTCRYSAPGHHVDFMRFYSHNYRTALQKSVVFVIDR